MTEISIRPLNPAIGAEIHGVDLRDPLDPDAKKQIHDAWLSHQVIFFPAAGQFPTVFVLPDIILFIGHSKTQLIFPTLHGGCSFITTSLRHRYDLDELHD
jgi:alpha-ketoglutarate-dependent taurine dioxygenase